MESLPDFAARLSLAGSLVRSPQGRRRLARAAAKRAGLRKNDARIVVTSTTFRSRPDPASVSWSPRLPGPPITYVERVAPNLELKDYYTPADVSTATTRAVLAATPPTASLEWEYPAAIDAWNLADLLQSLEAPLPHGWARAEGPPAMFVAVDPLGAGSILFARSLEGANSVVVLTSASQIDANMLPALTYADALVLSSDLAGVLEELPHHHVALADTPEGAAAAVAQAASDLQPLVPDPIVSFRPGSLSDGELNASDEIDVLVRAVGGGHSAKPEPRTFANLVSAEFGGLTVLGARISIVRRYRSVVEREDDLHFIRLALTEGYEIGFG